MLVTLAVAGGCGGSRQAPVIERVTAAETANLMRPVNPGDTLYSIAWEADVDYRELARWNGIEPPYVIQVGQRLRLSPPAAVPRPVAPPPSTAPAARKPAPVATPPERTATPPPARPVYKGGWGWPVNGPVLRNFSPRRGVKGIDIAGRAGTTVRAAASGEVVYDGSGLRGYGQLIIIKHDETYLSAYAHNEKLLVSKGQNVNRGQAIAHMGSTGTDRTKLHFQIRRDGVPVNPLKYLPRR